MFAEMIMMAAGGGGAGKTVCGPRFRLDGIEVQTSGTGLFDPACSLQGAGN